MAFGFNRDDASEDNSRNILKSNESGKPSGQPIFSPKSLKANNDFLFQQDSGSIESIDMNVQQ